MKSYISDKIFVFATLLLLSISAKGQTYTPDYSTQRAFACIVLDAHSGEPLNEATLRVGRFGWSADAAGRVEALANIGDTLVFTHVGYNPAILKVKDSLFSQNLVAVSMSPDTVMLSEVLIKPRRLTLSQEAKQFSSLEQKNSLMASHVFASSTQEALTAPKTWGEWNKTDNQKNTLERHTREIEYKGMIPPEQMFNLTNIALATISAIVKKLTDRPRRFGVTPLTEEELHYILTQEEEKQQEE